jgi:hypothetical protein
MADTALSLVEAWHAALNSGDVDRLVTLVTPDVEMGGGRGVLSGAHVLREWFERANVRLHPLAVFQRGNIVVVEERGQWLAQDSGAVIGDQTVASVFEVNDGLIRRITRYDDVASALGAARLTQADRISGS